MKHTKGEAKNNEAENSKEVLNNKHKFEVNKEECLSDSLNEDAPKESTEETLTECNELDAAKEVLEDLQAKFVQLNDAYLRTLAEFDNYRKRTLREKAELIKTGGESVLINVLDVVDDVERGIASSKMTQDVDALREGMELIHSKFITFLKQNGIKEIETEGKVFNTDHHEAIVTVPAPDESLKGKVIECVQKGYYLHDKVIRFAKVVVGE